MYVKRLKQSRMSTEVVLFDQTLLQQTVAFYGQLSAFLLRRVWPEGSAASAAALVGDFTEPSASPRAQSESRDAQPTALFAALPEYFVDDVADFLIFLIRSAQFMINCLVRTSILQRFG